MNTEPLSERKFWALISENVLLNADGSIDATPLGEVLASKPLNEIAAFARRCWDCYSSSRTYALWGAAGLIHDGAPDDTFDYFRSWLVGRGRETFEAAIRDPDTLADVATPEALDDELYCIASAAYQQVTGELPSWEFSEYPDLGTPIDFTDEDSLKAFYPRLYTKFRSQV